MPPARRLTWSPPFSTIFAVRSRGQDRGFRFMKDPGSGPGPFFFVPSIARFRSRDGA